MGEFIRLADGTIAQQPDPVPQQELEGLLTAELSSLELLNRQIVELQQQKADTEARIANLRTVV